MNNFLFRVYKNNNMVQPHRHLGRLGVFHKVKEFTENFDHGLGLGVNNFVFQIFNPNSPTLSPYVNCNNIMKNCFPGRNEKHILFIRNLEAFVAAIRS